MKWVVNSEFINNYTHSDLHSHTPITTYFISYKGKTRITNWRYEEKVFSMYFFIICDNERKNGQLYCNLFRWQKENEKYTKTLGVREEWNVKDRRMCRFPKDFKDRYAYSLTLIYVFIYRICIYLHLTIGVY